MKNRTGILIIALFAIFLAVFSTGCKRKAQPIPTPTATPTPIPKLEKIVFTFNGDLFWINTDGTGREELFPDSNSKWFPSVSPDGFYIAYWVQNSKNYNLWIADFRKNKTYQITFDEDPLEGDVQNFAINSAPSWTKNSEEIYYSRNKDVWKITRDGYNQIAVTDSHNCISPALSGNGLLVYTKIEQSKMNIFKKPAESMNDTRITNFIERKAGSSAFSPDGNNIAFTITDGDSVNIYGTDITAKETVIKQLTFDGSSYCPSYSHDGQLIVFSSYVNDKYQPEIWTMKTDGTDRKKLTQGGGISPSWLYRLLDTPLPTFTATPAAGGITAAEEQPKAEQQAEPEQQTAAQQIESPVSQPAEPEIKPPTPEDLAVKVKKEGNKLVFMPIIHFDSASDNIKEEFYPVLDDMVKIASRYESPIIVEGHTDDEPINTKEYPDNKALSLARAKTVKKYLVEKHAIKPARIIVSGFGEDKPLVPNTTADNMYINRRAEFFIKLNEKELNKPVIGLETPTVIPTDTPTPIPTPTPKLNFIQKILKKKTATKAKPGQKTGGW